MTSQTVNAERKPLHKGFFIGNYAGRSRSSTKTMSARISILSQSLQRRMTPKLSRRTPEHPAFGCEVGPLRSRTSSLATSHVPPQATQHEVDTGAEVARNGDEELAWGRRRAELGAHAGVYGYLLIGSWGNLVAPRNWAQAQGDDFRVNCRGEAGKFLGSS